MAGLGDVVSEFLVESRENLDQFDRDLVELEREPSARERLGRVFRAIHTIKGTCGFLGFSRLEAVTHAGENLLSLLRDGELTLTPELADGLLAMADSVRRILSSIETSGSEGDEEHADLIERLHRLQTGERAGASPPASHAGPRTGAAADAVEPGRTAAVPDASVRVDVERLDRLMNLVGELVLARNQIQRYASTHRETALAAVAQRLSQITTELQEGVMRTRMLPVVSLWSKLPRHVRDLAAACGKKVRLEMEGAATELDRSIIEAIRDPLTHLVRNAVDHGIEPPRERAQSGKPLEGRITLIARHEGGQVIIEITDDGAGIEPAKIRREALARGLLTEEQAASAGDREALNLIFLPGFSTASEVTSLSGRGVGMDVVKSNVERLGGTVEIQSRAGLGATVRMKIPLTLAIVQALIVECGGGRYAVPQAGLLELVRLDGAPGRPAMEDVHGVPVFRLRERLLPVVFLDRELGIASRAHGGAGPAGSSTVSLLVLQADGRPFGLVVDDIRDTEEIVVKPLGRHFKGIPSFAGATILGDGAVALIVDVLGLAQRARVVSEARDRAVAPRKEERARAPERAQTLLVFGVGGEERVALPLSLVTRLEEIPSSSVERAGRREVVQYRSGILPLIRLSSLFGGGGSAPDSDAMQVLVHQGEDGCVGLVVDRIHDIVQEDLKLQSRADRDGVLGTAIIQQRVTSVLDIRSLLRGVEPARPAASAALEDAVEAGAR